MTDLNIAVIPARAGSLGIPQKNIRNFLGKPLVQWTIELACSVELFDVVVVSTDCEEIKALCEKLDVRCMERPSHLAGPDVHAVNAIIDVVKKLQDSKECNPTSVTMLLPTAPGRSKRNITEAFEILEKSGCASVVGVLKTGKYINNIRTSDGNVIEPIVATKHLNDQRQNQKEILFVSGALFLARTSELLSQGTFHAQPCAPLYMNYKESVDINSEEDFVTAENLLRERARS